MCVPCIFWFGIYFLIFFGCDNAQVSNRKRHTISNLRRHYHGSIGPPMAILSSWQGRKWLCHSVEANCFCNQRNSILHGQVASRWRTLLNSGVRAWNLKNSFLCAQHGSTDRRWTALTVRGICIASQHTPSDAVRGTRHAVETMKQGENAYFSPHPCLITLL